MLNHSFCAYLCGGAVVFTHESSLLLDGDTYLHISQSFLAVAKALRRAAEGKASAQAEAVEWKRKYELERARNLQLEHKGCNEEKAGINYS